MFFFNLSLGEFLALVSAASAVVVALYLLDRSRRKIAVPTLRFWNEAKRPVESTSRRRIRQWPSLLLQLASIAALLAALSQLRIGQRDTATRDHVLILDTSSWMAARDGRTTLMEQARAQALDYARAIPASDRLLVLYADALATPATAFETDRKKIEAALRAARPGNAALDLRQALETARRLQSQGTRRAGEIAFAGAARTSGTDEPWDAPPNLRLLEVKGTPENVGLRKMGLRHSSSEPGLWQIYVSLKNYGRMEHDVDLSLNFAGAPVGARRLRAKAGAEVEAAFDYRTRVAGPLTAELRAAGDTFAADDVALLELPALPEVNVTVCSPEPMALRALVESHPSIRATYRLPGQCIEPVKSGIVVFDRFVPAWKPTTNALYLEPAGAASPVPVKAPGSNVTLARWDVTHPVGLGLGALGFNLASTQIFAPGPNDRVVAESSAGPVIVARDGGSAKVVVLGFHPMRSALRYELSTPLLFANIMRWMSPASFRAWELFAGSVGTVTVPLLSDSDAATARVLTSDAQALPFTVQGRSLRFFAGKPGTVRVLTGDREQVHSLTLPGVADRTWQAPANVRRGVPRAIQAPASSRDIWQWLALAGGLGLLAEWLLFAPLRQALAVPPADAGARLSEPSGETLRRAS